MERRLTTRGQERRDQLMAFAARRFAEAGYHDTSVAEIVRGLGVGKGVFYWYFSSKEELFREILREAQRDLRRRQREAIGDEPDPIARIEAGIRASVAWFAGHRDFARLVEVAATDERFAAALRKGQEIAVADSARHIKDAIVEGRIADGDPQVLAHGVFGLTAHLCRRFVLDADEPAPDIADVIVDFCLNGLRGR